MTSSRLFKGNPFSHASIFLITISLAMAFPYPAFSQTPPDRVSLWVNHVGYTPDAGKVCVIPAGGEETFEVVEATANRVVFSGTLKETTGDFGTYRTGDFSAVANPGYYYVRTASERSYPFVISENVYDDALQKIVSYFAKQRCGASGTGYFSPCHTDDGVRIDNGKHIDVTGGWHDASDLRKWVVATIYGIIGLARVSDVLHPDWDDGKILGELKWGNKYFLSMQEQEGYIMDFIGGDVIYNPDNNRWTDNVIGTGDDRLIQTRPVGPTGQYNFITSQALVSRFSRGQDPGYSKQCLEAGLRCLDWCLANNIGRGYVDLGAAIEACVELYKTTQGQKYRDLAAQFAKRLSALQYREAIGDKVQISGFYMTPGGKQTPDKDIWQGCMQLMGLADLVTLFPDHPDVPEWKNAIRLYAEEYLAKMASLNNFGIVPYGLFAGEDPGGNRIIGGYYYRYFFEPDQGWWVGNNALVASAGVGLLKAAKILGNTTLASLAQRQLDWILGVNPFNASTIDGVGYNQPQHFIGRQFYPFTPHIDGAVMNGIGGFKNDMPDIKPGSYHTCEFWTPMVAYTMWLMAELEAAL